MKNLAQKIGQKFVNSVFDDVHTHYDKTNDAMSLFLHRRWKKKFVEMLNISPQSHVLDLASGTGDIAKLLIEKTKNIVLADINQEMLTIAKKKLSNFMLPQESFVVADAKHLPFEDETFDYTTCVFGVRNFQELELSIKDVHRCLKKGGTFAIMEFMPNAENASFNPIYRAYIKHLIPKYDYLTKGNSNPYAYLSESILKFQTKHGFIKMLEEAGFTVISPSFAMGGVGVFLCKKN